MVVASRFVLLLLAVTQTASNEIRNQNNEFKNGSQLFQHFDFTHHRDDDGFDWQLESREI